MKKLGLRAVAGGLAVLMAVAGFAPATANAADVLTAKASKTLVITADMVDDDGEIVISNENWDRIIVEKEVNAKDIYFDGVEVGELVVESGGESNIQLWDVEAEQVTVKEPELVNLDINEIRTLYADKETKAQAFELYMKTREDNKNTLTKVPSIVTMEDAVVESLSVSGSVDLNVAQGAVKAVTLEANAAVSQMNVTLNGYDGDVAYKGTEGFSVINLNSVNCAIENLTVEGSATNNYLNVESKNSTTANVEVAGNAGLSLNIPIAKLDVVAGATAAQVSVLSTVDELNVTASNASVNVGADAKVAAATIVGDKVSMSGEGKLAKVDITGKDASVSTSGTGIKGENTYRPPVEKKPETVEADPVVDLVPNPGNNVTISTNEDGSVKVDCFGNWQGVRYNVPETATKVNEVTTVILNITAHGQFGLQAYDTNGNKFVEQYPGYGLDQKPEPTTADYYVNIDPTKNVLAGLGISCMATSTASFTINSITFVAEESTKLDTFEFTVDPAEQNVVTVTKNPDGSATISATEQWKGAAFTIPSEVIGSGKIVSVTGDFVIDNQMCWQAYSKDWSAMLSQDYPGWGISAPTDKTFTLSVTPTGDGISVIRVQSQTAGQAITVKSITVSKALWVEKNW